MELTNELLKASLCKTREEAQLLIQKADKESMRLSGTPYGFPMDIVTHPETAPYTQEG